MSLKFSTLCKNVSALSRPPKYNIPPVHGLCSNEFKGLYFSCLFLSFQKHALRPDVLSGWTTSEVELLVACPLSLSVFKISNVEALCAVCSNIINIWEASLCVFCLNLKSSRCQLLVSLCFMGSKEWKQHLMLSLSRPSKSQFTNCYVLSAQISSKWRIRPTMFSLLPLQNLEIQSPCFLCSESSISGNTSSPCSLSAKSCFLYLYFKRFKAEHMLSPLKILQKMYFELTCFLSERQNSRADCSCFPRLGLQNTKT